MKGKKKKKRKQKQKHLFHFFFFFSMSLLMTLPYLLFIGHYCIGDISILWFNKIFPAVINPTMKTDQNRNNKSIDHKKK
jgi:hypothetical protein